MEREINFKAKMSKKMADAINFGNQVWIDGYYYKDLCNGVLKSFITDGAHKFEVEEDTVCQYTGLKDQNKKKIYSGDIVKNDEYDELCVVEYEDGQYIGRYKKDSYIGIGFYVCERDAIEVVGNIWDNKDLIKDYGNNF